MMSTKAMNELLKQSHCRALGIEDYECDTTKLYQCENEAGEREECLRVDFKKGGHWYFSYVKAEKKIVNNTSDFGNAIRSLFGLKPIHHVYSTLDTEKTERNFREILNRSHLHES